MRVFVFVIHSGAATDAKTRRRAAESMIRLLLASTCFRAGAPGCVLKERLRSTSAVSRLFSF